jgi:hypothetical protein
MNVKQFASLGGKARAMKVSRERLREIALLEVDARQKKRRERKARHAQKAAQ